MKSSLSSPSKLLCTAIHIPCEPSNDAKPLFLADDTVIHPSEGVCIIKEFKSMCFRGSESCLYYVLKPSDPKSSSTVYLPVPRGNAILRRLFSEADILALIHRSSDYAGLWIADSKQRKDAFTRILQEGNYAKIIRMVLEIHQANAYRIAEGKKACASDEAILQNAERLLHQEFSYVLKLSKEETIAFIIRELGIQ